MKQVDQTSAINRKYPEWIFQLVTVDKEGNPNAMPAGWCTFASANPAMLAVSVAPERYTHSLLRESEDFVLAFPNKDQKEEVYYCGTNSGRDVDKFAETGLRTTPSSRVNAPLIENSVACYECKKRGSLEAGDHTLFLGEIVAAHISEQHKQTIYTTEGWAEQGPEGFKTIAEISGNS